MPHLVFVHSHHSKDLLRRVETILWVSHVLEGCDLSGDAAGARLDRVSALSLSLAARS